MTARRVAREEQVAVFQHARDHNTLAIMPTNSGKTMIAAMLIHHYLSLPQHLSQIVLFVAPTVVLARQQAAALARDLTGGTGNMQSSLYGGITHKIWKPGQPTPVECPEWMDSRSDIIRCFAGNVGASDTALGLHWNDARTWHELFGDLRAYDQQCQSHFVKSSDAPPPELQLPWRRKWLALLAAERAAFELQEKQATEGVPEVSGYEDDVEVDDDPAQTRLEAWPRIFVMTPDKLLNYLQHGLIQLADVSLLVVDECHHVEPGSPYGIIMNEFYAKACPLQQKFQKCTILRRPRILGLTASPISEKVNLKYQDTFNTTLVGENLAAKLKEMCTVYNAYVHTGYSNPADTASSCWAASRPLEQVVTYQEHSVAPAWARILRAAVFDPITTLLKRDWELPKKADDAAEHFVGWKSPRTDILYAAETARDYPTEHNIFASESSMDPLWWLLRNPLRSQASRDKAADTLRIISGYRNLILIFESITEVAAMAMSEEKIDAAGEEAIAATPDATAEEVREGVQKLISSHVTRREKYIQEALRREAYHTRIVNSVTASISSIQRAFMQQQGSEDDEPRYSQALLNARAADNHEWQQQQERLEAVLAEVGIWGVHQVATLWYGPCMTALHAHSKEISADNVVTMQSHLLSLFPKKPYTMEELLKASSEKRVTFRVAKENNLMREDQLLRKLMIEDNLAMLESNCMATLLNNAVRLIAKSPEHTLQAQEHTKTECPISCLDPAHEVILNRSFGDSSVYFARLAESGEEQLQCAQKILNLCKDITTARASAIRGLRDKSDLYIHQSNLEILLYQAPRLARRLNKLLLAAQRRFFLLLYEAFLSRNPPLVKALIGVSCVPATSIILHRDRWQERSPQPLLRQVVSDKVHQCEAAIRKVAWVKMVPDESPSARIEELRKRSSKKHVEVTAYNLHDNMGRMRLVGLTAGRYRDESSSDETSGTDHDTIESHDSATSVISELSSDREPGLLDLQGSPSLPMDSPPVDSPSDSSSSEYTSRSSSLPRRQPVKDRRKAQHYTSSDSSEDSESGSRVEEHARDVLNLLSSSKHFSRAERHGRALESDGEDPDQQRKADDLLRSRGLSVWVSLVFKPSELPTSEKFTLLSVPMKMLIFCKTRLLSQLLSLFVQKRLAARVTWVTGSRGKAGERREPWRSRTAVRHHTVQSNMKTPTAYEQQERVKSFRKPPGDMPDIVQALVATSVVEEGFDLPECSAVVRFNLPDTLAQNVQSRGRAREPHSQYFLFVEDSTRCGLTHLSTLAALERLTLSLCQWFTYEAASQRNEMLPDDNLILAEIANKKSRHDIWNPRSGAFIPLGRAAEVLDYLLMLLSARRDEDGLPIERHLRSWLATRSIQGDHSTQAIKWDKATNLAVTLPPLLGNAENFTPITNRVALHNEQSRQIVSLLYARAIRFLHKSAVIDDSFLPPARSYGFYETFYRKKKKLSEGGNTELLWREAPELLMNPDQYKAKPSNLHHSQEWTLLKLGSLPLDDADALILATNVSRNAAHEFMSIGIKGAAGQTPEDVRIADAAVRDLTKHLQGQAEETSESKDKRVLPPVNETESADDTPMYTLYPHQVWYKVSAWNSEVLKSGGLYGFWRLHYNAHEALKPPQHMVDFAGTAIDSDAINPIMNEDGDVIERIDQEAAEDETLEEEDEDDAPATDLLAEVSTQFAVDAQARKIGSQVLQAMKQVEKSHPSERELEGECRCCLYPGVRLSPEADPLMVLQPQVLLLRAPLPRPVESVFTHASNREVVKVIIRPITVQQLAATEWASATGSEEVASAIDMQSRRGLKASFSPEGEDLAEYTQPISYEISNVLLQGLRRAGHDMKRVWTVYSFNSPANALLRNKDIAAIMKSDNDIAKLLPPFMCMAPLKADGVSIDIDHLMRTTHLTAFTRSANVRDTFADATLNRIREAAAPSLLEMFRDCPEAVAALDPSLFMRNASESVGEAQTAHRLLNRSRLSLTKFFCPHSNRKLPEAAAYISSILWSPRILETDCEELTSLRFEPGIALREFDEGRAQIKSERRLALIYLFKSEAAARCAQLFEKSYRGIPVPTKSAASLARCIAFHTILRGAEEPLLRMTHERSRHFHFYRMAGIDWTLNPTSYTPQGSALSLYDIYQTTFHQEVDASNTFLLYGDKCRQGPRICLSDEHHPRSDNCHAPQFAICMPYSESMMQQLSWSPALYWVLDSAVKHMECKLKLDLTFSRAVPRFCSRDNAIEAGDMGTHTKWHWSVDGINMSAPIAADVSLDQEYITNALTSPSALSAGETPAGERKTRMRLFDLLQGKYDAEAPNGEGLLALLTGGHLSGPSRQLLTLLLEQRGNSHLEGTLQKIIGPWLGWNMPSPYLFFRYFPRPALRVSHNQVLEFLGDAVLKYVAAVWAFFAFKDGDEGVLTSQADTLKRNEALRAGVRKHRLHPYLLCRPFATRSGGKSGQATLADLRGQRVSFKQQADVFEALLGAVYWSHYHRIDFWPSMSDYVPLSHVFSMVGKSSLSTIGIDEYGALTTPYFLHPSWTGSSAGVFVSAMFIEAYIMTTKVRETSPLVQIFATLRDIAAWDLLNPNINQRLRAQQTLSPSMPSAVKVYPDLVGDADSIKAMTFAPMSTEERVISSFDVKEAWPSSVCWKSSKYPFRFDLDNPGIEVAMREYFPTGHCLPVDFDSTIKGIAQEWCLNRGLPPRVSNQKFLRAWFRDCPAKSRLRPDVYRHLCSARIHSSARGEVYGLPNYERLEFLGDAALALLMTEWLNKEFPDSREGPLSYARAILQSNRFLCRVMLRKLLAPPAYVATENDSNVQEDRIADIDASDGDIKPSQLLYHGLQGQARYRFTELDLLQASLKNTPASGDFQACYDELAEEDVQRAQSTLAQKDQQEEEEGDAEDKLVSFNRYKFIADVYESMIGVMLFEFRFDLRAVWETIKGDFLASHESVAANIAGNEDFLTDEKARQRSDVIAKQKAQQEKLRMEEHERLRRAKELCL